MPMFMSDTEVVTRILDHIAHKTTDRGEEIWQEPVEHYRCEDRFAQEMALFKAVPIPFCPSIALAKPGDYIARRAAGTPLMVVRGQDGIARAFLNACRHRGAELATGTGCTGAFVCPYHGWSYGLDGSLLGITHADGFPDFDMENNGLAEVTVIERSGIIFIVQQDPGETDDTASDMLSGLPHILKDDQIIFSQTETIIDANWKLHLESFIEGYHIKPAHKTTFYPFGYDNLNVIEHCGPHSRVTFPFRRIEQLKDSPAEEYDITDKLTFVTHLFPNVILAELSHHRTLGIIEPLSVSRSKVTFYHLTMSTNLDGKDTALHAAKRDLNFVNDTGQMEDIALVASIQNSLNSTANPVFTFGHFEAAIVHFHKQLSKFLVES